MLPGKVQLVLYEREAFKNASISSCAFLDILHHAMIV
jgi:hypothetical protein